MPLEERPPPLWLLSLLALGSHDDVSDSLAATHCVLKRIMSTAIGEPLQAGANVRRQKVRDMHAVPWNFKLRTGEEDSQARTCLHDGHQSLGSSEKFKDAFEEAKVLNSR